MPKSRLAYLRRLTDDFGVWQHSKGDEIDLDKGYALDDSARALIVYLQYGDEPRAKVCLDYLAHSQLPAGFVGFFDRERRPLDQGSSDDAHALAIWALAEAVAYGFHATEAKELLGRTTDKQLIKKGYLRTLAYLLLAYSALEDRTRADELAAQLDAHFDPTLGWFEDRLTYANAALPLALLRYKRRFHVRNPKLDAIIKQSLQTLETYNRIGVIPAPVGNRLWQRIGSAERDIYGQQPIDSGFMVLALLEAYNVFGQRAYFDQATDWMEWFHGNNIYKANLISDDYACVDGLNDPASGIAIAHNKGAESVIMYLMALHSYERAKAAG